VENYACGDCDERVEMHGERQFLAIFCKKKYHSFSSGDSDSVHASLVSKLKKSQ
jgi:hypothetical protein